MAATSAVGLLSLLLFTAAAANSDIDTESLSTLAPASQQPRKLVKRAPASGFIGMRGKKQLETDDNAASPDDNWLGPDPLDYGDTDADNYYAENAKRLKKAPTAFVGMRGKKHTLSNTRLVDLLQHLEEQRMRESLLENFLERLTEENSVPDVGKRAPTGFTGMRGKRPDADAGDDEDEAMELLEKRAPVNSFVGVRGKKDVSHQHYKRAVPLSEFWRNFFKKAYDVRGKKQRFTDFNKFVAVRGKKNDMNLEDGAQYLVSPWAYLVGDKRAPNGFLGMRGKRPALVE